MPTIIKIVNLKSHNISGLLAKNRCIGFMVPLSNGHVVAGTAVPEQENWKKLSIFKSLRIGLAS